MTSRHRPVEPHLPHQGQTLTRRSSIKWSCIRIAIRSSLVISAIPLALVMAVGGFLSFRYNMILKDNRDLVVHTHQVISAIQRALGDIKDAETGQRGYLITGDLSYLTPYETAVLTGPGLLNELRRLVADRPDQLGKADKLGDVLRQKLEELNGTIAIRRNQGFEVARAAVLKAGGKDSMDRIRTIAAEMVVTEESLLAERTGRVARDERNVLLVAGLCAVLSIATRIVVELVLARRGRRLEGNCFV